MGRPQPISSGAGVMFAGPPASLFSGRGNAPPRPAPGRSTISAALQPAPSMPAARSKVDCAGVDSHCGSSRIAPLSGLKRGRMMLAKVRVSDLLATATRGIRRDSTFMERWRAAARADELFGVERSRNGAV